MESRTEIFKRHPHGIVLYDGSCGACTHFVGGRAKFYGSYGFGVTPAQEPWVEERLGPRSADAPREIRLLRSDGSCLYGADVYREIFSKIWWLKPMALLSRLPGLRFIFNGAYRAFSANRGTISKVCGLEHKAKFR
jgi:hypothetical protein